MEDQSLLSLMVQTTPTDFWNDSCAQTELETALAQGAVGATSNPIIVTNVLKSEFDRWQTCLQEIINNNPTKSETAIAWRIYEQVAARGAQVLLPVFDAHNGQKGRLSIQVDPTRYNDTCSMVEQAERFTTLAPNVQVKFPVTKAGLAGMEEATYRGIPITGTVCFTVSQAIAVAEAVERGLNRRQAEGKSIDTFIPVCAFMVGRTDDWMRVLVKRDQLTIPPEYLDWAGIACVKKTYQLYQQRKYRTRLLIAAYRSIYHWTEFIGGDLSLTITKEWQDKINQSGLDVYPRMHKGVDSSIVESLYSSIPDFRRAFDENGLSEDEFLTYGATTRTLRSFIQGYYDLLAQVREVMLPNPDQKTVQ